MKKVIFAGLAGLGLLAASCVKDQDVTVDGTDTVTEKAAMTVTIKGENGSSRAIGTPSADTEKTVHSFTVYVFNNSTGVLEATETFTDGLQGTVTGLGVASPKKVVVFVNQPDGFPSVTSYDNFSAASAMIALDSQVPGDFSSTGLFMSGESQNPVTLSADNVVQVPVTVSRLTAKVRLGSLTIAPEGGVSLENFTLTGVSIQQARNKADVFGIMRTSGFEYVGGVQLAGSESARVDYLNEFYSLPVGYQAGTRLSPEVYFYVFGNDNTDNNATLMNVYGTYNGKPMYFVFSINDKIGAGGSTTDGNWIERNKIYTLNMTLKKIGNGGTDPNVPNEEVSMNVEVGVEDWEDELIQEVEW